MRIEVTVSQILELSVSVTYRTGGLSMRHAGFETLGTTMHGNVQYAVLI
jgi:hypothetical protein